MKDKATTLLENENIVYSIINKYTYYFDKDDLYQAGCIGLIEAYYRYKQDLNTKFTTYAYPYILGEMRKLVREDKGIKISRKISSLYLKIEKVSILLSQRLMREPSVSEIASFLEIDEDLVVEAINSTNILLDVDEIPISHHNDYMETLYLQDALDQLNDEEKNIIQNRYLNDMTQTETANIMGISQVQVSRKEQKVLQKLKKRLVA